jgi:hypothetical protein
MSTIEELLGRKSSGSCLESLEYGHRDPSRGTFYPRKLAQTLPTSGGGWVGVVGSRAKAKEFSFFCFSKQVIRNFVLPPIQQIT